MDREIRNSLKYSREAESGMLSIIHDMSQNRPLTNIHALSQAQKLTLSSKKTF